MLCGLHMLPNHDSKRSDNKQERGEENPTSMNTLAATDISDVARALVATLGFSGNHLEGSSPGILFLSISGNNMSPLIACRTFVSRRWIIEQIDGWGLKLAFDFSRSLTFSDNTFSGDIEREC